MIRQLTADDVAEFKDLINSQPKMKNRILEENRDLLSQLSNKDQIHFGSFDANGTMTATIGITPWKIMPYVSMHTMVQLNTNFFDPEHNDLINVIKVAYQWAEDNEYYTFYSARTYREYKLQSRLNIWNSFPDDKYVGFIEEYIPANTESKSIVFQHVLGSRTFPEPYVIRCQKLKNKYRFPKNPNKIINPNDI